MNSVSFCTDKVSSPPCVTYDDDMVFLLLYTCLMLYNQAY